MSQPSTPAIASLLPRFTGVSLLFDDRQMGGAYAGCWASGSVTGLTHLSVMIYSQVQRAPALTKTAETVARPSPNARAIALLRDWIEEDKGNVYPDIESDMREFEDNRLSIGER